MHDRMISVAKLMLKCFIPDEFLNQTSLKNNETKKNWFGSFA